MQETVKAAASYFYANRSVFDAGRLRFQGFAAETQISNEIGGTDMRTTKFNMKDFGLGRVLRRDRDQRYPLPEDRSRYQDRIAGADRGDGGILPCEPGLSAAGRNRIQQQGEERYPGGY